MEGTETENREKVYIYGNSMKCIECNETMKIYDQINPTICIKHYRQGASFDLVSEDTVQLD